MERNGRNTDNDPALKAVDRMIHLGREAILFSDTEVEAAEYQIMVDEWLYRREQYLKDFYGIE